MSALELEAKRWRAAVDAVNGKNDLRAILEPRDGWMHITIEESRITDESIALMKELGSAFRVHLQCKTAEWQEMLAQGVG